ncbi:MAG: sulfotransferase domain-containing protein [Dongiaceae bacterium]
MSVLTSWWTKRRAEARWWRKQEMMFRGADVLVVSHTKSGRTWLRVMISHLYHLRYGVPPEELIGYDNFQRLAAEIPRMHFVRDTHFDRDNPRRDFGLAPERQKVVFLIRDPRDVAISFYFQVRHRATDRALGHKGFDLSVRSLPLASFVADPRYGVPRVIRHFNSWLAEMPAIRQKLVVRYEDLKARPEAELARIASFLSLSLDEGQIAAAVRFASFESLREKERSGFFNSRKLGGEGGNPESFKVRRGEVSGYRQYVTAEQAAELDRLVATTLDPAFGYAAQGPEARTTSALAVSNG